MKNKKIKIEKLAKHLGFNNEVLMDECERYPVIMLEYLIFAASIIGNEEAVKTFKEAKERLKNS